MVSATIRLVSRSMPCFSLYIPALSLVFIILHILLLLPFFTDLTICHFPDLLIAANSPWKLLDLWSYLLSGSFHIHSVISLQSCNPITGVDWIAISAFSLYGYSLGTASRGFGFINFLNGPCLPFSSSYTMSLNNPQCLNSSITLPNKLFYLA